MKYVAPALVVYGMVCFTDPQGFGVWVDRNQVVSVQRATGCAAGASAKISLGNATSVCIQEDRKTAVKRLDESAR